MRFAPVLRTPRLVLDGWRRGDAGEVARLCGHPRVALMTEALPYPYREADFHAWLEFLDAHPETERAWAVRADGALVGAAGLRIEPERLRAELGYWIGVDFQGRGFATEAVRAVIDHAFRETDLRRLYARHYAENRASARVLEKAGFHPEGLLVRHALRLGVEHDVAMRGLHRDDVGPG